MDKAFIDDFSETLPLFKYADENVARTVSPDMEKAMAKATKVISLHSITAKPNYDKKKNLSESEEEFYSLAGVPSDRIFEIILKLFF